MAIRNDPHAVRKACLAYLWLTMHEVDPTTPQDVSDAFAKPRPLMPDVVAGCPRSTPRRARSTSTST